MTKNYSNGTMVRNLIEEGYVPGKNFVQIGLRGYLTTREVFPMVRRLCAECHVVGMEVVEVAPLLDPGYTTAFNALRVIQEAITGLAMRKEGLTEPQNLDPRTSGQEPVPGQRTD